MPLRLGRSVVPFATALTFISGCLLSASPASASGSPGRAAEWWLTALGAPQAWSGSGGAGSRAAPGAGVTVGVLSTGVDADHPDLAGDVITGPDDSHSGASPGTEFWGREGTAVASLIAGHGHGQGDAKGITGVAPGARILSLRVTLEYNDPRNANRSITTHLTSAIAAGIRYEVSHGASVIALPLDPGTLGSFTRGDPAAAGGSAAELAAIRMAEADDVVLVAPAGDNAWSTATVNYPAAYPGVIAVGATGRNGHLEPFSSTRSYVALTAPGDGLTEAAPGGGYGTLATTDMSAALVAGVAALIRARYPGLNATQVTEAIEKGTTSQPAGTAGAAGAGAGALNAARALHEAASLAATVPQPATSARGKSSAAGMSPADLAASGGSAVGNSGIGNTAASVLHYTAIGTGTLIVALASVLLFMELRRRRKSAARERELAQAGRTGPAGAGPGGAGPGRASPGYPGAGSPHGGYPTGGRPTIGGPAGRLAIGESRGMTGGFPAIGGPPANGGFPAAGAPVFGAPVFGRPAMGGSPDGGGSLANGHAANGHAANGGGTGSERPAIGGSPARGSSPATGGFRSVAGGLSMLGSHGAHAATRGSQAAARDAAAGGQPGARPHGAHRALPAGTGADAAGSWTADSWTAGTQAPGGVPSGSPRHRSRPSRLAGPSGTGSVGGPAPQPASSDESPPWAPAKMPEGAVPVLPVPVTPMLPRPAPTDDKPPWEQDGDPLPQGGDGASFSARGGTGPLYIWNPATNTGPFPALPDA